MSSRLPMLVLIAMRDAGRQQREVSLPPLPNALSPTTLPDVAPPPAREPRAERHPEGVPSQAMRIHSTPLHPRYPLPSSPSPSPSTPIHHICTQSPRKTSTYTSHNHDHIPPTRPRTNQSTPRTTRPLAPNKQSAARCHDIERRDARRSCVVRRASYLLVLSLCADWLAGCLPAYHIVCWSATYIGTCGRCLHMLEGGGGGGGGKRVVLCELFEKQQLDDSGRRCERCEVGLMGGIGMRA